MPTRGHDIGADMSKTGQGRYDKRLDAYGDYSSEGLCARIFERHRDRIKVQKPRIAVANLARIITAALDLANRQGFHATTLRDLARESGLSMGGLYSYFDSKDTLLLMILGEVSAATTEVLNTPPAQVASDPARHLEWLIQMHVILTESMLPWFVFAYLEAKSFPPAGRRAAIESEATTEQIFAAVLAEGARRGDFAIEDPGFTAALIKPLLQDWYVKRGKWRHRDVDADGYAKRVWSFIGASISKRP